MGVVGGRLIAIRFDLCVISRIVVIVSYPRRRPPRFCEVYNCSFSVDTAVTWCTACIACQLTKGLHIGVADDADTAFSPPHYVRHRIIAFSLRVPPPIIHACYQVLFIQWRCDTARIPTVNPTNGLSRVRFCLDYYGFLHGCITAPPGLPSAICRGDRSAWRHLANRHDG